MKIAVITCYDQNDYIRATGLRTAFAASPDVESRVIKNQKKGVARYFEIALKIIGLRFGSWRPDAYVITFRGYEMLLYMMLTGIRKPIIFDEMINLVEYLQEHGKVKSGTKLDKLLRGFYGWQLRRCRFILADTQAHADFSAQLCNVPVSKFRSIPVAANEALFTPAPKGPRSASKPFTIFFYGNGMTPLHGLQHVLDAAVTLKDNPNITFNLVGGKEKGEAACRAAIAQGAHITFERWIDFDEIARRAQSADLTLGGPFGKSLQSQFVITGKTYQFLATGTPVLVGKNAVSGLFIDKQNCLLVEPADPQAIVQAITWAQSHPVEMQQIGAAGRQLYEEHFSQKVVNKLVNDMVQQIGRD